MPLSVDTSNQLVRAVQWHACPFLLSLVVDVRVRYFAVTMTQRNCKCVSAWLYPPQFCFISLLFVFALAN